MQTTKEQIAESLRDEVERIRADAEARMSVLQSAIELIESPSRLPSSSPPRPVPDDKAPRTTIPDVIIKAAEALGNAILDYKPVRTKAVELFPDMAEKIDRGIYPAFASLTLRKKLIKVPGGWKLPQFANGAAS